MPISVPVRKDLRVVSPEEDISPSSEIIIDGASLSDKGFGDVVSRVEVIKKDNAVSKVEVSIQDENKSYSSSEMFSIDNNITLFLGYKSQTSAPVGSFTIKKTNLSGKFGDPVFKVIGHDFEHIFMNSEKQKVFRNKSYSEIAIDIAEEVGLEPVVSETNEVIEHVAISNETYSEFLNRKALQHGFHFFVDGTNLFFKKPNIKDTSLVVSYDDTKFKDIPVTSSVSSFDMKLDTLGKGKTAIARDINIQDKSEIKRVGDVNNKTPTRQLQAKSIESSVSFNELTDSQAVRYLYDIGEKTDKKLYQRTVNALSESDTWIVSGKFTTDGLYKLSPSDTVTILGIGRFSGKYYVKEVRHILENNSFTTECKVVRGHLFEAVKDYEPPGDKMKNKKKNPEIVNTVER